MVLLQDRVEQARKLLVRCRDCFDYFHNALFPLNPCPKGLLKLLEKFKYGRRIFKFIYREMISGAMSALAWVKVHHQQIDLAHIAEGFLITTQENGICDPLMMLRSSQPAKSSSGSTKRPEEFDKPKAELSRRWSVFPKLS